MEGYSVTVREASKELTGKEKVQLKDTSNAIQMDEATKNGKIELHPAFYAVLDVHNEKSDNKDYHKYIIVDDQGNKYVTGSESFWNAFKDIFSDMSGEDTDWSIEAYRLPSKNYKGKEFITCSLI